MRIYAVYEAEMGHGGDRLIRDHGFFFVLTFCIMFKCIIKLFITLLHMQMDISASHHLLFVCIFIIEGCWQDD